MTVIFKLGGSLLTVPDLAMRLRLAFSRRSDKNCLVVVGGGSSTDIVREWSRIHELDEETAHWLAISSLNLNRELLESIMSWRSIATRDEALSAWKENPSPLLLNLDRFLKDEESDNREALPHHWNVTSDSLAAWGAICWPAEELILLKSVSFPIGLTASEASDQSLLDPIFPNLAKQIKRISWCNLRSDEIVIDPWLNSF